VLLAEEQQVEPKIIAIDSKDYDKYACLNPDLIKPNYDEARKILSQEEEDDRLTQALKWPESLAALSQANWVGRWRMAVFSQ